MGNLDGFNPDDHEDAGGDFDVIPAGWVMAIIVKSELRNGKKEGSTYINAQCQIVEGPHERRVFFHMFTRTNKNPESVAIGDREIATVTRATGVDKPKDFSELHDIPLMFKLVVTESKDYGTQNKVKGFKSVMTPIDGPPPVAAQSGEATSVSWKK